jgi:con80 domain of Katanin
MKDQTVTNDFLHYYIIKNDMLKISLTLDNVLSLLPHINAQLNSKYEVYQICALKSARNILNGISEVIRLFYY